MLRKTRHLDSEQTLQHTLMLNRQIVKTSAWVFMVCLIFPIIQNILEQHVLAVLALLMSYPALVFSIYLNGKYKVVEASFLLVFSVVLSITFLMCFTGLGLNSAATYVLPLMIVLGSQLFIRRLHFYLNVFLIFSGFMFVGIVQITGKLPYNAVSYLDRKMFINIFLVLVAATVASRQLAIRIQQTGKKIRKIFNDPNDAIIILKNGKITEFKTKTTELFKCTPKELYGLTIETLSVDMQPCGLSAQDAIQKYINMAMDGEPQIFEWKHKTINGEVFDAEISLSVFNIDNEIFIQAIVREISERKKLAEELEKIRILNTAIIEGTHDYIWTVNANDFGVISCNSAFRDLNRSRGFEIKEGSKIGDHPCDIAFVDKWNGYFRKALVDGAFTVETETLDKDVFLLCSLSPLYHDGKIFAISVIGKDISEQKALKESLFQSEKLASLGTLISGVVHEINNPNNFIMLNADIFRKIWNDILPFLEEKFGDEGDFKLGGIYYSKAKEKIPKILQGISDGSDRIANIVAGLKDYVRPDSGKMNQSVNIKSIVDASILILSNLIRTTTDNFTCEIEPNLPELRGNPQQLEQIVINLISNACQALESRDKALVISALKNDTNNTIEVSIKDEGKGIRDEDKPHVFDPFFTTKRDTGGTGLGLAICYGIAQAHGGSLTFDSTTGQGTVFKLSLPITKK